MTQDHDAWEALAVGYAFSALEPEDEQRFLAHLGACDRCPAVIADTAGLMAQLGHVPPSATPPEGLRAAILAAATASRTGPAVPVAEPAGPSVPSPTGGRPAAAETPAADELTARRDRRAARGAGSRARVLVAAAAALAVIGVAGAGGLAYRESGRADLAADQRDAVLGLLTRPGSQAVVLQGTGAAAGPGQRATAVVADGRVYVAVSGLPATGDSASYVLWGQSADGALRALGSFDVPGDRPVLARVSGEPVDLSRLAALAVTREPGRTLPTAPGSAPLLAGQVTA